MTNFSAVDLASGNAIATLVKDYRKNGPLPREFYVSPNIFQIDMTRVFGRSWLFAGYSCTIPRPGDYFTYQIGSEPVVFVRGQDGEVRAFYNTCRHRGSRICTQESGHAPKLTCPYHRWTYELDGRLLLNTVTDFGVDRDTLSLHKVAMRDVAGLLFVSLADDPPPFDDAFAAMAPKLKPHGFDRAKVAQVIDYTVRANWKIIFENNRECYHCPPNHREYNTATYDVIRDQARADPKLAAEMEKIIADADARFQSLGLGAGDVSSDMTGTFYRCNRTPVMTGFVTETLDGKPACTIAMGDLPQIDVGTLRTTVFPNFWQHANGDYAAAARLTPLGPDLTAVRGYWLVHKDAVEGKDYTLDRVMTVWSRTNEQDWQIVENQQIGVTSTRYQPGPFSRSRETNVAHFDEWYLSEVSRT